MIPPGNMPPGLTELWSTVWFPHCLARAGYATRELVYLELYPPSTPNQTFSGAEYVGIIGRIEDYQRGDNVELPATQMPQ